MNWQKGWWKRPLRLGSVQAYPTLLLILLLAFALRLYGLANQSLWWDELKTWERATVPLNQMLTNLIGIRDQVPLYYWMMRFWRTIGTEPTILRLFSVYFGTLSIPLVYKIGRRLDGQATGLLSAFLLAISPFHIWYSQEVRMYTLLPALLLLAHFCLLRLLQTNRWQLWLAYGLAITAALYTHYFAFFVVLVHYIFFVLHLRQIRPQTMRWFLTMLAVGAAFAPWAYLVITQTTGYSAAVPDWINRIQWHDLLQTLTVFAAGFGLGRGSWLAAICAAIFLVGVGSSLQFLPKKEATKLPLPPQTLHTRLLFIWFLLPLLITFLVSVENGLLPDSGFSVYHDRYLLISLPPFLLLAALGWQRWRKQTAVFWPLLLLISIVSGIGLWQQVNNPAYARTGWNSAFAQMEQIAPEGTVIIGHKDVLLPVSYYGNGRYPFIQIPPPETDHITPVFAETMAQQLALAADEHSLVWHIEQFYNFDPHGYPDVRNTAVVSPAATPTRTWLNAHFTILDQRELPGLRLTLYDLEAEAQN
ncbi:MAG: glycosyltransferase family 39 protein [Ardenticatenaceae bacterium]|nr:glycosyltransferase family 39 protein [Anaerolineales bacterium]MCB9009654.1 glycosyltransferase family 39 protein [Ardenticatenaceae bacterium]